MNGPADHAVLGGSLQGEVIAAMRAEVQEYGGLLQMLHEQQNAILKRQPDEVLALDEQVNAQLIATRAQRKTRETLVATLTNGAGTLVELLPQFREPVRPLVQALVSELNQLLARTRRRAQQNRMLLARGIEVTQEILQRLNPETVTRTYSAQGRMKLKTAGTAHRLEHQS